MDTQGKKFNTLLWLTMRADIGGSDKWPAVTECIQLMTEAKVDVNAQVRVLCVWVVFR